MHFTVLTDLISKPEKPGTHREPRKPQCSGCEHNSYTISGDVVCTTPKCVRFEALAKTFNAIRPPGNWPQHSRSVGCLPKNIGKVKAGFAACGVDTDYTSKGEAIFRDNNHKNAHMRVAKVHDNDAYYN